MHSIGSVLTSSGACHVLPLCRGSSLMMGTFLICGDSAHVSCDGDSSDGDSSVFTGAIDGQGYLLDVNDSGSYKPKGTHYMIVCTEDLLRVSCDTHTLSVASIKHLVECIHSVWPDIQLTKKSCSGQLVNEQFSGA